jgi:putative addiction module component (TIGR02574 family)
MRCWLDPAATALGVDFRSGSPTLADMSTAALTQTLFSLPVGERITLADQLYASVPAGWQQSVDQAWLEEAERRSEEMDAEPGMVLTHEQFLAGIELHRREA